MASDFVKTLAGLLASARRKKIAEVVAGRTSSLVVVLENVLDQGNRNAVMRTMDATGVHTLHRLNFKEGTEQAAKKNKSQKIRTDSGARKWIVATNWEYVSSCVSHLRIKGYKIASTLPGASLQLPDVDFTQKLALVFGNENTGVSKALSDASDFHFSLPMTGFVHSLNLSVCVAVTLYQAHFQRLVKLVRSTFGELTNNTLTYNVHTLYALCTRQMQSIDGARLKSAGQYH